MTGGEHVPMVVYDAALVLFSSVMSQYFVPSLVVGT